MHGILLILKNSFRNTFKTKFQLVGLTLLVTLLALVLSLITSINSRVIDSYTRLRNASNVHQIVLQMDPFEQVETGDVLNSPAPKNLVEAQQYWLSELQKKYWQEKNGLQFEWSRTEGREFSQVKNHQTLLTLKTLAKITPNNILNQNAVDELVVFSGHQIESPYQVVVDPIFAEKNHLHLRDIIRIQSDNLGDQILVGSKENQNLTEKLATDVETMRKNGLDDLTGVYQQEYAMNYSWFQIVGFGGSADFIMPVMNSSSVLPNRETELLIYVDPLVFDLLLADDQVGQRSGLYEYNPNVLNGGRLVVSSNNEWESFYSLGLLNNHFPSSGEMEKINADFTEILKKTPGAKTYFYSGRDPNYRFASRTLAIDQTVAYYNLSSSILEILLVAVIFYTIGLVTRKQVEKIQGQIGTLKALGYAKKELVLNVVMTPFFTAILGAAIGYGIAVGLSGAIIQIFADYFLLNYGQAQFDWVGFLTTMILLWMVLTAVAFLIAFLILRKDTLALINAQQISKRSKTGTTWKAKEKAPVGAKITSALLTDASGKMSVVGIVVLIATMVFTMAFAAPDILTRNQTVSYSGVKYKQIVEYSDPVYNNPLSFYKTFNHEAVIDRDPDQIFNYSNSLNGFSSLPLKTGSDDGYDVDRIFADYALNQINNEFFSIFLNKGNEINGEPIPEIVFSNMRYLSARDIASSTNYYRFISKYGLKGDPMLNNILLKQWPDYTELVANLGEDQTKNLRDYFNVLQRFYSKYVNSISLAISSEAYGQQVSPELSDDEKIAVFNQSGGQNLERVFRNCLDNEQSQNFSSQLKALQFDGTTQRYEFTDSSYKLGAFHISDGEHNTPDEVNDYFLSLRVNDLSDDEVQNTLALFILWFAALFSNRGDQAIIQGAYYRSPYFVQQFYREAFKEKEPYVQGFAVVSYNPEIEQIGTRLKVKGENGVDFKIYGVDEKSGRFLDLKNRNSDDLLLDLVENESQNGIIINQSVAKIFGLKTGDTVNLKVLQEELQEKVNGEQTPINLSGWEIPAPRDWDENDESKNGFTQLNKMDNSISLHTPAGKKLAVKPNILLPNDPSQLYKAVLEDQLLNQEIEKPVDFKVVGIHEGYGQPQAWIKETTAQEILQFDQIKKLLWEKWFVYQWGNDFKNDHQDLVSGLNFQGSLNWDFTKTMLSYDDFLSQYVNSDDPEIAQSAQIILDIFNHSFPIFNYKYSNKDDVGDLKILVSIHQKFGDYSPVAMQGMKTSDGSYDGAGSGAIGTIVPVEISKAILKKISDLVLFILILAILAILLITFVIIFLTTALIIEDNIKFIATMKVLGYSNRYLAGKILGMYFIVIATVFVIGFICGWFSFAAIINSLLPTIVLPLKFQVWLPFVVLTGVVGIYLITIGVGFSSIAKANAVAVLQNNDL